MTLRRERAGEIAAIALLVAVAVLALAQSWNRWLDPIIDAGRDLYIPEQIRAGTRLYRDVLYFYPPLTPYLLAAITAITGSSLAAYTGIGIAIAALTAAALYVLVRRTTNWTAAFGATLLFIACSVAGASTYGANYIFPYAHAATLAMLFYLGCVAALQARWFGAAMLCALLSIGTKIDFIPAIALLLLYALLVQRMPWKWLAAFVIALVASIAGAALFFGFDNLRANVFPPALLTGETLRVFYRQVSGLANLGENLRGALLGAIALVAAAVLLRYSWIATAILTAAAAWFLGFDLFRAWTILQLALIPYALRKRHEPLLLLLIASLGATARVFFNPAPEWYGFVLIVPLYALIAHIGAKKVWLIPMAIIAATTLMSQRERWAVKQHPVATARGTIYDANPDRAAALNAVLPELAKTRSLVVMPEGLQLNYFARVPNPTRVHTFTPPEIAGLEASIVRELEANPPQTIVVVTRDVSEFGYRGFGIDYGREIAAWLGTRYRVVQRIDAPRLTFVRYDAAANATP
jgi:Dolichyl-phosphate-mannose-protein mannosyltransferase